jgi:hypothetical protein
MSVPMMCVPSAQEQQRTWLAKSHGAEDDRYICLCLRSHIGRRSDTAESELMGEGIFRKDGKREYWAQRTSSNGRNSDLQKLPRLSYILLLPVSRGFSSVSTFASRAICHWQIPLSQPCLTMNTPLPNVKMDDLGVKLILRELARGFGSNAFFGNKQSALVGFMVPQKAWWGSPGTPNKAC